MSPSVRRAGAFALITALSLSAPTLGDFAAVPFAVVAVGAFLVSDGPLFEILARPRDRREGRLSSLGSFALAVTGLGLLVPAFDLPPAVFAAAVLLVGGGEFGQEVAALFRPRPVVTAVGFAVGAAVGAVGGQVAVAAVENDLAALSLAAATFFAVSGAVLGALVRTALRGREDPLVVISVGLALWLLSDLVVTATWTEVGIALAVTAVFGYLSWALDTASVPGMLTGVLLGVLTMVLGNVGWFVVLFSFFVVGGLATKYRYDRKLERGVAQERGGTRGSGNVLGNSLAALVALLLFAASEGGHVPVGSGLFAYAFAGSVATALADTLSSEIGGLFDDPRLVTTFERVEPGTDGAVTWQGEVAGLAGAALVASLGVALLGLGAVGAVAVVAAGFAGMTADSLLGALVEGDAVGNQTVNFLATATGAVSGGVLAVVLGLAAF